MLETSQRQAQLTALEAELVRLTQSPLYEYRNEHGYKPVLGEGPVDAHFMCIGEAPGKNEAITGRPFIGSAGRILDELFTSAGMSRNDVYITSIVKDRPPENRDPTPEEIRMYAPFLDRQITIIQPHVIVTLGRFSMAYIFEKYEIQFKPISEIHGSVFTVKETTYPHFIVPLYHPAAALYNPNIKTVMKNDMKVLTKYASISA